MTSLHNALDRDSIKVADLGRIHADHDGNDGFADEVIRTLSLLDPKIAWRAVWLLKELARDRKLSDAQLVAIAEEAGNLTHWAARLNLCQLFAKTGCPRPVRDVLYPFLVDCFGNRRPMIRAWAITVLAGFTDEKRFRKPVDAMLRKARADPAASVRARLRRLRVSGSANSPTSAGRW